MPQKSRLTSCEDALVQTIDHLNKTIRSLEKELEELVKNNYKPEIKRLKSVIGVGDRIASGVLAIFEKFDDFQSAKKAISFIGAEPAIRQSGSSINSPAKISKKGNGYLRGLLYMGAMSACKYNPSCKELYERLKQKKKPYKLIMVAVGNKLLRQMFAVLKNETSFDPKYKYQRT